jgi:hypothetical protein
VANLTRADGREFLGLVARQPLQVHAVHYPLASANEALADLRGGRLTGTAVLEPVGGDPSRQYPEQVPDWPRAAPHALPRTT